MKLAPLVAMGIFVSACAHHHESSKQVRICDLTLGEAYRFNEYLLAKLPSNFRCILCDFREKKEGWTIPKQVSDLGVWEIYSPDTLYPEKNGLPEVLLEIKLVPIGTAKHKLCTWERYEVDQLFCADTDVGKTLINHLASP